MPVQCEVRYGRLSIFKRADRSCYSVSFKDANGKYLPPISTGKKTEKEAMEIAFKWLNKTSTSEAVEKIIFVYSTEYVFILSKVISTYREVLFKSSSIAR
jgi:hypothetical protein